MSLDVSLDVNLEVEKKAQKIAVKSKTLEAQELLRVEAEAILSAADRLGAEFDHALEIIQDCARKNKKLILMGMGKSHYVAAKIAASFMSTGVTALFVHPAEAIHGDLGIISEGDVCVLISKSGSTPEIVALLPFLKAKSKLISIIGNKNSAIGLVSDCILDASVEREACPINLLPTASTTLALALGDALVATFAKTDGFNPEKFAGYHPGGSLGKRLLREVHEVMLSLEKIPLGQGTETLQQCAELMSQKPVGAFCVVDQDKKLKGIVVDGDIRRALAQGVSTQSPIEKLLIKNPTTIRPDIIVNDALATLERKDKQITAAPVVDQNGSLVGFVRIHDLI
jgi:arabinose-5-phosphate isomerase